MAKTVWSLPLPTGAPIPALGFGTSGIEPDTTKKSVLSALAAGYRHLDCCPLYGNEREVGDAIAEAISRGILRRHELFVTTKLPSNAHDPVAVIPTLKKSLSDLQLEYVDLFLIHWPIKLRNGAGFPPQEEDFLPLDLKSTWQALEGTVERGLAKAIGVCNFSRKKLESMLEYAKVKPAVDQVEMHPGWQQQALRSFCKPKEIHVSAFAPLGAPRTFYGRNDILTLPAVLEIAARHGKTPAQVVLRWALQQGVSVLPKSSNPEHIIENSAVWDWELTTADIEKFSHVEQSRMPVPLFCNNTSSPYKSAHELWDGEV